MTPLNMTHEAHHTSPPTHTLLDAIARARQLAHESDQTMIVYWDDDYHTYHWLPLYDYHHTPEYQTIDTKHVHWSSDDGYYIRPPQAPDVDPDDHHDADSLATWLLETCADIDTYIF